MAKASINIDIFGTHSCWSDSISSMGHKDVTIEEIMKSAGWSSGQIFRKFYFKPIKKEQTLHELILADFQII